MQELKKGSLLDHGKYQVMAILGQGGFGITYLVKDRGLDKLRAIKEFYPRDFCDRDPVTGDVKLGTKSNTDFIEKLKEKFIKEARNIASLDQHQGIVKIHSVFLGYNTAYYVMDFIDGDPLSYLVSENGPMPLKQAIKYVTQVGEALEYVHAHRINHLDIKPANIMIREKDDRPILIDFGLSKQYDSKGNETSSTPTGISHGYAPLEQYKSDGITEFSPQTDVYSLAATLFFSLTGEVPPAATDLLENPLQFPPSVPEYIQKAIQKGMASGRKNRHETVSHFLRAINRPPVQSKGKIIAVSVESDDHIQSEKAPSQQPPVAKGEAAKTQKTPVSPGKQEPQKAGCKPVVSQTQGKVQSKPQPTGNQKGGISQPQPTGNQKGGISQPQPTGNQKGRISQPQPAGNQKGGISQPQPTGNQKGGISQPQPTGNQKGGISQPQPTGNRKQGISQPQPTGNRKGGISQPQSTGNRKQGISQPQPTGNQKGGISQPQPTGNRTPGISQPQPPVTRKQGISHPTQHNSQTSTQILQPTQPGPSHTQTLRHPNTTTSQPGPVGPGPQKNVQSPTHPNQQKNNSNVKRGNNQRTNVNQTGQRPPQTGQNQSGQNQLPRTVQNQSGQNQPPRTDPIRTQSGGQTRPMQAPRRINFDPIINPINDRFEDPLPPPVKQKNSNYEFLFIGGLVIAVIVIIVVIFAFMRGSSDNEERAIDTVTVDEVGMVEEAVSGVFNDPFASLPDTAVTIQTELNKF